MKRFKQIFTKAGVILSVLLGLLWINAGVTARTFTTIRSFGILTNVTGFNPTSELVKGPDGTLYGTASQGEGIVAGTLFKMQPDGSGFTVLKLFDWPDTAYPNSLILSGGNKKNQS